MLSIRISTARWMVRGFQNVFPESPSCVGNRTSALGSWDERDLAPWRRLAFGPAPVIRTPSAAQTSDGRSPVM
jgi:hypothetical protein